MTKKIESLGEAVRSGNGVKPTKYDLTADKIKRMLPKGTAHEVTDNIMEVIHRMEDDIGLEQDYLEEQLLSHINIIKEQKVDLIDYINAVKYCTLKQNMSNRKAWEIVFPERLAKAEEKLRQREKEGRASSVNIDSHVSNYNSNKIVVAIDSQMAIAWDIKYMPARVRALSNLIDLGNGIAKPSADGEPMTVSPHVQFLANKEVVDVLKPPEDNTLELKIGPSEEAVKAQNNLAAQLAVMAEARMKQFETNRNLDEIQKLNIVYDVGVTDDEE